MRSLSTSQLVVLWYGGIIISSIPWDAYDDLYKVLAVTVLTGLVYISIVILVSAVFIFFMAHYTPYGNPWDE